MDTSRNILMRAAIVLLALPLIFHQINYLKLRSLKSLAYQSEKCGEIMLGKNYYSRAYTKNSEDIEFILMYGSFLEKYVSTQNALAVYLESEKYLSSIDVQIIIGSTYLRENKFNLAAKHFENAHFMIPSKITPLFLLTKTYIRGHRKREADSLLHIIENMNVKVISPSTIMMIEEIKYLNNLGK